MIEVFKTNVTEATHADKIIEQLLRSLPGSRVNFDLDDCDRVLRVEGKNFSAGRIIDLVARCGYSCAILD